ncbi:MAG: hypothetical protein K2K72_08270 [Duncaniella sp.]|nr:hypothetical protein [Duncaniella sp.]
MTSEIFSPPRFLHVLRQHLTARRKELSLYALTSTAMILFFIICYLWELPVNTARSWVFFRTWVFIPFWVITLCLCVALVSKSFADMRTTTGMLTEATTPASQLEKFLARWIIGVPLPIIFCLTVIKIVELTGYVVLSAMFGKSNHDIAVGFSECLQFSFVWIVAVVWLQAFYFLGAIAQRRFGAIITAAVIALLILITAAIGENNILLGMVTSFRLSLITFLVAIPTCCYIAAWHFYRRADIR